MYALKQLLLEDVSSQNVDKRALHFALIGNLYEKYFLWEKASEYYDKACKLFPENAFITKKCQSINNKISEFNNINLQDDLKILGTLDILSFLPESGRKLLGGLVEQKENKFKIFAKVNLSFSKLFVYIEADKKVEPVLSKLVSIGYTNFMIYHENGKVIFSNSRQWKKIVNYEKIEFPEDGNIKIILSKVMKSRFYKSKINDITIDFSGKGQSSLVLETCDIEPQILLALAKKYFLTFEKLEKKGMIYDLEKEIINIKGNRNIKYKFIINYDNFLDYLRKLVYRIIRNEMLPDLYSLETAFQFEKQMK